MTGAYDKEAILYSDGSGALLEGKTAGRGLDSSKTILRRIPVPQRDSWKPPDSCGHLGLARVTVYQKNSSGKFVRKWITFADSKHGGAEGSITAAKKFLEEKCDCDGRILD